MKTTPQLDRVSRARARLVLDNPFFGVLALHLTLINDPACETAWTDGTSIAFAPQFVDTLSTDELLAVLAHEVLHCACGHPWRRDNREPRKWNVAADYAINAILRDSGFKLPDGALLSSEYAGKSAEWIFDRLPDGNGQQPQQQNGNGNGQGEPSDTGGMGETRDAPPQSTDSDGNPQPSKTEADWQQVTTQAKRMAQAQGSLPGGIARDIAQATKQPADWRALLRRYIQDVVKADYSWTRPNPRYVAHGLYMPSLHSVACGPIAVAIDTSGSIDDVLLGQFAKEIEAIANEVQPAHIDAVYVDTDVNHSERFERDEPITFKACGRGGTDFRPAFEHVDNLDTPPAVMIYLTDLMGTSPQHAPSYPVIWACYGDYRLATEYGYTPSFGDVIPCE